MHRHLTEIAFFLQFLTVAYILPVCKQDVTRMCCWNHPNGTRMSMGIDVYER